MSRHLAHMLHILFVILLGFLTLPLSLPAHAQETDPATLCMQGLEFVQQGDLSKAFPLLRAGFEARESGTFEDANLLGMCAFALGAIYYNRDDLINAQVPFHVALDAFHSTGERRDEGYVALALGRVHQDRGEYDQALTYYQQALTILRQVGDRNGEGATLYNIASIYQDRGEYDQALTYFQQALTILRQVGDRAREGVTLYNMGHVYHARGEYDQALTYFQQAMDVLESVRAKAGSDVARATFISQYGNLYQRAAALYHILNQDEQAFLTSERGRARTFLDALATGQVHLRDDEDADLFAREQETYAHLRAARDALARAYSRTSPDPNLIARLERDVQAAEQAHQDALAAIEARHNQLAALVPGRSAVLTLADVQALLDQDTTLVSYYMLGDEGTLVFIITHNTFSVVDLPDVTPEKIAEQLVHLLRWPNLENPHPLPLQRLYAWLVAPLKPYLHTPKVGIIPHWHLHYVPFAALSANGDHYFGDEYTLFLLPSASAYRFIQENRKEVQRRNARDALVLGNPATGDPDLPPLVHSEVEARTVAQLLGVPAYIGPEAQERLLWENAGTARVVHLAAHGGYNPFNPLYSLIALAPGGDYDGRLEVHEIFGLDLRGTDLVVLSACQTNVGNFSEGDEIVSMTRAFFFAGTPTVIASLWFVDDEATQVLMEAFYKHWYEGMSKAEALQAAQADVRSNPRWRSPFYWAGFVLNGDPGLVSNSPHHHPRPTSSPPPTPTAPEAKGEKHKGRKPVLTLLLSIFISGLAVLWWVAKRT